MNRLLDVVFDVGEGVVQIGAQAIDRNHYSNGDAGGDERVLDGGRSLFTAKKPGDSIHVRSLLVRLLVTKLIVHVTK
jgi:hypothetical protein